MKRMVIVLLSLVLVGVLLPLGVLAEETVGVVGTEFELIQFDYICGVESTFSPDGKWFAHCNCGPINLVPMNGGETIRYPWDVMINDYNANPIGSEMAFSPDGKNIATTYKIYDTTKGSTSSSNGIPAIVTIDIETGEITYVVDGQAPNWSPDGRYILYSHHDFRQKTNLYCPAVYDTQTGEKVLIEPKLEEEDLLTDFVYALDGEYYYFEYYHDYLSSYICALGRMPVGGGDIEIVTESYYGRGRIRSLDVTPDGKWALFNFQTDVLLANLTTGKIFNAMSCEEQYEPRESDESFSEPFWFPDYSKIGYIYNYEKIYVMDFDSANYVVPSEDIISTVDDNQPEAFATLSNFPNPFNPVTTIEFSLPEAGDAELVIYDITGRKVRELADGFYSAGSHSLTWDARDDAGIPVSSGVYMSRLISGDAVVNIRMTYVR